MTTELHSGVINRISTPIGFSVSNIPIQLFKPDGQESSLLIMAGQHGEEPEGTVLLSKALRSLEAPLTAYVLLAANPDGLLLGTRGNANGVDLNRNYPSSNWSEDPVFHRWSLHSTQDIALTPGPTPSSEPETIALVDFIVAHGIKTIVSLHGPLACIDDPEDSMLGRWLSAESGLPLVTDIGYPTPGSLGSWSRENGVHIITYEFPPESSWALQTVHVPLLRRLLADSNSIVST